MAPPMELNGFGIERELEYTGHITLATHLVPLPRRTFASADETHIRVWGAAGDVVKSTFPSNRRSMVSAMTYCPTFYALLTCEVDMTLKAYYMYTLDLIDTFSLAQAPKKGEKGSGEKGKANEKVSSMVYFPKHHWVLVGGENGCDLWHLSKSNQRRTGGSVGRLEHHLELKLMRRVANGAVINMVADMGEKRIVVWGPSSLTIFDTDLNLITSCRHPHSEPMHCACIQIVSILDTTLLTGGEDCNVNLWSIQGKQATTSLDDFPNESPTCRTVATASMRLEHSFRGHSRTVEMVGFYHRKHSGTGQSLCVSYARDGKMKVWSLIQFSLVYTLDVSFLDSKVFVFPLAHHFFAVSASASGGSQPGSGQQRTSLSLMRFSAHMACPFATTNQSSVVLIDRPLPPTEFTPSVDDDKVPTLAGAVALVSEDVAIRIVDAESKRLIATLPPPPNSKVQVIRVFIVPVWQILILWLSSQEIAIFFVPAGVQTNSKDARRESDADPSLEHKRAVRSTTPLLIRRFSILEVRAHSFDKELPKEAFRCVALHHGQAPPNEDTLTHSSFESGASGAGEKLDGEASSDWFLVLGTHLGTIQAYRLREILAASPIWNRIVRHLPRGAWRPPRTFRSATTTTEAEAALNAASDIEQKRLDAFEAELQDAIASARVPGQRPFPRDAATLRFHGRWKCHSYFIEVIEAVSDTWLSLDMKRNLKLWNVDTMQCVYQYRLGEFSCHTLYMQPRTDGAMAAPPPRTPSKDSRLGSKFLYEDEEEAKPTFSGLAAHPGDVLGFVGLAIGSSTGSLQLVMLDRHSGGEPFVVQSTASHTKSILQVDFIWPLNVFVTIGADDAMKIWTHGLVVLREIVFPQPLTAVSWRHRHDLDTTLGHGDILLGFACHVETLSFEYWSKGAPDVHIGRDAIRGKSPTARNLYYTNRGSAMVDGSEEITDHELWLSADDPVAAREYMISKKGVGFEGAGLVAKFKNAMLSSLGSSAAPRENNTAALERLNNGDVADFRGPPCIEIGTLSGISVEQSALELSQRPSKEPYMRHKRTSHHNQGDFAEYTHAHPGYYDKYVHPNTVIDAPRIHAIRGSVDGNDAAIITSVGTMEREPEVKPVSPAAAPRSPRQQEDTEKTAVVETVDLGKSAASSSRGLAKSKQPTRQLSQATLSKSGSVEGIAEQFGLDASDKQPLPGDEPWRCQKVARGAPKEVPMSRTQNIANSEWDTAVMLKERGNLALVPDLPEENQLKRLLAKKADWLYSPNDSAVLSNKRKTIMQMEKDSGPTQTWTPAGRLVCGDGMPPAQKASMFPSKPPPYALKQRMPVTRREVTEQRIIANASVPPRPPPRLTLEAKGPASTAGSARRPASARSHPDRPLEERNGVPGESSSLADAGRELAEKSRAPLTAR